MYVRVCSCKLDHRSMTGTLTCNFCDAKFNAQINSLSEPIDLFTDWVDEATELQAQVVRNGADGGRRMPVPVAGRTGAATTAVADGEQEEEVDKSRVTTTGASADDAEDSS